MIDIKKVTDLIKRGIIVSCQAKQDSILRDSYIISLLAKAAELGGAVAIRADKPEDIRSIGNNVDIPIIGINKIKYNDGKIIITPNLKAAEEIIEAGADIIAIDMTFTECPIRYPTSRLVQEIHQKYGVGIIADISTEGEALKSAEYGADAICTTLSGYTSHTKMDSLYKPDFCLIEKLVKNSDIRVPIIAEGRFWKLDDVKKAFDMGVYAVTIGKAITNPRAITEYYVNGIRNLT